MHSDITEKNNIANRNELLKKQGNIQVIFKFFRSIF